MIQRRIAIITHKFVRDDGQGRVNYEVVRGLLSRGHQLILIGSRVAPELVQNPQVEVIEIPVSGWPTGLLRNQIFALRSALAVKRARADIVVANGFITWSVTAVNAVHFVHGAWLKSSAHEARQQTGIRGWYQWVFTAINAKLELHALRKAGRIVAVSSKVLDELVALGVPAPQIEVITNGVDIAEFFPAPESRKDLGLPCDGVLALFAGGIKTYRKNLDGVLKALVEVPLLHLAVAGGTDGSPFPLLARQLGVENRVHFLGHRKDVPRLMRAVDFFVFPSRFEAMSLVVLEALASGLPVITTKASGTEGIVDSACGIMLDSPDDQDALVTAMRRLADDVELRVQLGSAARAAAEQHSWQRMAERYAEVIERAAQPPAVLAA